MEAPQTTTTSPEKPIHASVYKYRINELFVKIYGIYGPQKKKDFCQYAGITRQTLSGDSNILLTSREEIPRTRLHVYAQFFNLKIEDLTNE
jgi:hypothetical protein